MNLYVMAKRAPTLSSAVSANPPGNLPNGVRGESHSGNVAAAGLAAEELLDILSSDYYPASLLQACSR